MSAPPVGWTPVRVDWDAGEGTVDWCWTEGFEFTKPAFTQTIEQCLREPYRLLFRHRTALDALDDFAAANPGLPPAGFVFHMSRCGSTLVTQMLAQSSSLLTIAEAPSIDGVLRGPAPAEDRVRWLRSVVTAVGQSRRPTQRQLVVKLDAWHAGEMALVRRAFPRVPFLFVYRDPVEVMVSHTVQRGAHMIPGALPAATFGIAPDDLAELSLLEYGARVLAHICTSALDQRDDPLLTFVNHRDLARFVEASLPALWNLDLSAQEIAAMSAVTAQHAKNPGLPYQDDAAAKQATASPELRALAERWLAAPYRELEAAAAA
jgi:gluconate kinase